MANMPSDYISTLTRLFSCSVIKAFARDGFSSTASRIYYQCGLNKYFDEDTRLADFFDEVYMILVYWYRNEYIFKNEIAKSILLERYSLSSAFMITELRAGTSIADAVILNGTSEVYEIKSDYDNVSRLEGQIESYKRVFDKINVITTSNQIAKVDSQVDDSVGILILDKDLHVNVVRESRSYKHQVAPGEVFDALRADEYTAVIGKYFGSVPDVPNSLRYSACKELFVQLSPQCAHDEMVAALKGRGANCEFQQFVSTVPHSLKSVSLSCSLSRKERERLVHLLQASMRGPINEGRSDFNELFNE